MAGDGITMNIHYHNLPTKILETMVSIVENPSELYIFIRSEIGHTVVLNPEQMDADYKSSLMDDIKHVLSSRNRDEILGGEKLDIIFHHSNMRTDVLECFTRFLESPQGSKYEMESECGITLILDLDSLGIPFKTELERKIKCELNSRCEF